MHRAEVPLVSDTALERQKTIAIYNRWFWLENMTDIGENQSVSRWKSRTNVLLWCRNSYDADAERSMHHPNHDEYRYCQFERLAYRVLNWLKIKVLDIMGKSMVCGSNIMGVQKSAHLFEVSGRQAILESMSAEFSSGITEEKLRR